MKNKRVTSCLFLLVLIALVLIATACAPETTGETADLVLVNGAIYTIDQEGTVAEALAIMDGKIMAVGSSDDLESYIGPDTEVIDLEGKMVLPGMNECHLHPPGSALDDLYNISLFGVLYEEETMETIREFVESHPDLDAYYGNGFSIGAFEGVEAALGPKKERLDEISPDKPVIIRSYDAHTMWVNSKALENAGITKDTPSPEGGVIEKDPVTGEPWGTLKESAKSLVPPQEFTREQKRKALLTYQDFLLSIGYTGIFSAGMDDEYYELYKDLEDNGELKQWVRASSWFDPDSNVPVEEQINKLRNLRNTYTSEQYKVLTAKILVDGVIEGVTGALLEPYEEEAGKGDNWYGLFYWDMDELKETVNTLNSEGFQVHVHAIGDLAIKNTLDAFEYAQKDAMPDCRNTITHLQVVDPPDFARFKELSVIASTQPHWHFKEPGWFEVIDSPFLGERAEYEYPLQSFFEAGAVVTSSSDSPVTTYPSPLWAMEFGVTRNLANGEYFGVEDITDMDDPTYLLNKNERASLIDMIKSFTINGAYQLFIEDLTGSIEEGKYADLVILDQDLFEVNPLELDSVQILKTFFHGQIVYDAED